MSEKRDSNPRPRPWQGRALPTELLSQILYPEGDLNPHSRYSHWILSPTCLPFHHPGNLCKKNPFYGISFLSEKRDSNPRPRPWQGRALPTELLSQNMYRTVRFCGCKYIAIFLFSKKYVESSGCFFFFFLMKKSLLILI